MSFSYNNGVPAANNNPSVDQPEMLINTQSNKSIWEVDHISFNDSDAGKHKYVTFVSKNTPSGQTDPSSALYTANGSASTVAEMFYKNQNAVFPISLVKAFVVFPRTNSGVVTLSNSYNIVSISASTVLSTTYTINITPGAISGSNVVILDSCTTASISPISYSYSSNVLTVIAPGSVIAANYSFVIIQI